jgi:hypothetical protein
MITGGSFFLILSVFIYSFSCGARSGAVG